MSDENKKSDHESQQMEKTKNNDNRHRETAKIPQLSHKDNLYFNDSTDTVYSTEDFSANLAVDEPVLHTYENIFFGAVSNLKHTELEQLSTMNIVESQTSSITSSEKDQMQGIFYIKLSHLLCQNNPITSQAA